MTEVTQADRDAAAAIVALSEMRPIIREGRFDDHDYVQAFARHRIAAEADQRERDAGIAIAQASRSSCIPRKTKPLGLPRQVYPHEIGREIATAIRNQEQTDG